MDEVEKELLAMGLRFTEEELRVLNGHMQIFCAGYMRLSPQMIGRIYHEIFNAGRICGVNQLMRKKKDDEFEMMLCWILANRTPVAPEMRN